MIRLALASAIPMLAFVGQAAPVSGFTRRIAPFNPVGSPVVRMSWERSEPPSAVGGVGFVPPGSWQGFSGVTGEVVFGNVPPNSP